MSDTGRALGTGRRDVQFTSDPGPFRSFLSVPLGETSVPGPFGPVLGRRPDGRTPVRINLHSWRHNLARRCPGRRRPASALTGGGGRPRWGGAAPSTPDGWLHVFRVSLQRIDRMGRTDQLVRYSTQTGATWPLTSLRSQGVPRRPMPRILDSQPNSIASVRVASVRPPLPTTCVRVYYDGMCGWCVAVRQARIAMRGRPGRRGGSKACLSIGASYHWYPWDLYIRWWISAYCHRFLLFLRLLFLYLITWLTCQHQHCSHPDVKQKR